MLEYSLGFRIIMTDRHEWDTVEIVKAFYGQSAGEHGIKDTRGPYDNGLTPEFHWIDQKTRVHYFSCVLGYLTGALAWREARTKAKFTGTIDKLFDVLNRIRWGAILEKTGKRGRPKAPYQLEELSPEEFLAQALNLKELNVRPPRIMGDRVHSKRGL